MKYKVTETYTPDNVDSDRKRQTATFDTDSTNPFEAAAEAYSAILGMTFIWADKTHKERLEKAKKRLEEDDVAGQVSDLVLGENGDLECFNFLLFNNNGEYSYDIEKEPS